MKMKTLSVLAGVGAPLIATATASAGFLGIHVTGKENAFGLLVCNVYADFDRQGEDLMQAVAGTAQSPLLIQVLGGGTFYNNQFGNGDRPPSTAFIGLVPSVAFDSFITMGVKAVGTGPNGQPLDKMTITPGFPAAGVSGTSLATTSSGWAITPIEDAADPFNPDYFAGNGSILIGQFSTADGTGISGTFLIQYVSNGVNGTQVVSFSHVAPTPGALALLGTAGLIGVRRRRRN